jgi:hypothetical protein
MPRYCLDANVLIQAKNGPYGFDIVPGFWDWLEQSAEDGIIYTTRAVYDEIQDGNDELASWVKNRRTSSMFVDPDERVQHAFRDIADFVVTEYPNERSEPFLAGADPWVIAQARVDGSIVVTHEVLVPATSIKVKIPNVCQRFSVQYIDTYRMLRETGASFRFS